MIADLGVGSTSVALRSDGTYYSTLRCLIERSTTTLLASVFIVDTNPHHDPDAKVLQVIRALECAAWRGVEVRLLIGGSATHLAIAESCFIARQVAVSHGIGCRLLAGEQRSGSHAKLVIADDFILSGSHNWSNHAFSSEIQDSVLIESVPLAAYLRSYFDSQWDLAGGESA
jgi:phosphatidylserine/phosphatidylglycerophosphate/cardiolipin synthase-like enzyme